ncbi:MAG: FAD binding domain-containing protein [Gammaproteobacteria bacterium]
MFPSPIEDYLRPSTVAEALAALERYEEGEAVFLAGGQSAMQAIKSRMLRPRCIVDLQDLGELRGITRAGEGLRIGALTRYVEIANDPSLDGALAALRDAASHVGDRQVRNRGTIGGSVCWNYVASCMPAVVLALGGTLALAGADGSSREVAADDFFLGPLETARREDEILLDVRWSRLAAQSGSAYRKWGLVRDALPVVGVCVLVTLNGDGNCAAARVALSGLAGGCQRAPAGEAALTGTAGDAASIAAAMDAIADSVETHSDQSADADYRRQLIRSLGAAVTRTAFERARAA